MLDVVQLQILARLGEGQTLTAIAHELSVHQSGLSRALHAAEQQVGLQLTYQQGRRLRLTPAGHEIALAAQSAAAQLADVDFLVERLKAGRTGALHVLAVSTPANYLLPEPLAAFMEQFPEVHVVLHRAISHLWEMFASGDYDVAVLPSNTMPEHWP
ncbi:MAG: LysR family transcriptional regulator, partial [Chloroflexota bacterium]